MGREPVDDQEEDGPIEATIGDQLVRRAFGRPLGRDDRPAGGGRLREAARASAHRADRRERRRERAARASLQERLVESVAAVDDDRPA